MDFSFLSFLLEYNHLLDIGNVIFFLAGLAQLIKTAKMIKNHESLSGVSYLSFSLYSLGCVFFAVVGWIIGALPTVFFNLFDVIYFAIVAIYAYKSRNKKCLKID